MTTMMKYKKPMARENRVRTFENEVISNFQASRHEFKIESYYTIGKQKKLTISVLMVIATIVRLILKRWVVFFGPCQGARPSLTDDEFKRGAKKKEKDELQKITSEKKNTP